MPFDNDRSKKELLRLLGKPRQVLLIVGSGSSRWVKYPSWDQLLDDLRKEVLPDTVFPEGLADPLQRASFIKNSLNSLPHPEDHLRQYRDYLESTFKQRNPAFADWHLTLARLPFCGIATTNYDPVLEAAVTNLLVKKKLGFCESIDACGKQKHHVFQFFRSLNSDDEISSVLHLHGYWKNAEELILTAEDYLDRYGLRGDETTAEPLADGGAMLVASEGPLDTFHRKIVWALLSTRPVLFVGFGVEDPAFLLLLGFVKKDFKFGPFPPAHIAILPSNPADVGQRERDAGRLEPYGVRPLFYDVALDEAGRSSHAGLPVLIEEMANSVAGSPTTGIADLSKKMLGR